MKKTLIIIIAISVYNLSYSQNALYGVINGATTSREGWACKCDRCVKCKKDTIASSILISHKSPSFGHGIDGYCIYKNDTCTGTHYKVWRNKMVLIGPEYIIWGCKRRNKQTRIG